MICDECQVCHQCAADQLEALELALGRASFRIMRLQGVAKALADNGRFRTIDMADCFVVESQRLKNLRKVLDENF